MHDRESAPHPDISRIGRWVRQWVLNLSVCEGLPGGRIRRRRLLRREYKTCSQRARQTAEVSEEPNDIFQR